MHVASAGGPRSVHSSGSFTWPCCHAAAPRAHSTRGPLSVALTCSGCCRREEGGPVHWRFGGVACGSDCRRLDRGQSQATHGGCAQRPGGRRKPTEERRRCETRLKGQRVASSNGERGCAEAGRHQRRWHEPGRGPAALRVSLLRRVRALTRPLGLGAGQGERCELVRALLGRLAQPPQLCRPDRGVGVERTRKQHAGSRAGGQGRRDRGCGRPKGRRARQLGRVRRRGCAFSVRVLLPAPRVRHGGPVCCPAARHARQHFRPRLAL